jgi:hypothetical protein
MDVSSDVNGSQGGFQRTFTIGEITGNEAPSEIVEVKDNHRFMLRERVSVPSGNRKRGALRCGMGGCRCVRFVIVA